MSIRYKKKQIPPKPKTPLKRVFKKTLSENSKYLWCDVFVLSKSAFLEDFLVLAAKSMSILSPF